MLYVLMQLTVLSGSLSYKQCKIIAVTGLDRANDLNFIFVRVALSSSCSVFEQHL